MNSKKNILWAMIGIVAVVCLVVVFFVAGGGKDKKENNDTDQVETTESTDNTENVPVGDNMYEEGSMVEGIEGVKTLASALDGVTMMSLSQDESLIDPEVIVWQNVWDVTQQFEFVPEGKESRYRIYPVDQPEAQKECLEFDEATGKVVMREKSDNNNQLFRIIYAGNDMYLIQAYNEAVLGFDLNEDGSSNGPAIVVRPYEEFTDSRLVKWIIADVSE